MCGIAGIFNLDGKPVAFQQMQRMANSIQHRGPDGEGFYIHNNIGLAHRRLAILDTSAMGNQPMASKNGEWIIVFNGCIYNFHDLKIELQSKGHQFVSTGDTEVIAEGLAEYGPSFFERLDGMFAVGAWNTKTNELWLSRDRYGVKPLYYYFKHGTFLFASEIKAFFEQPPFQIELNFEALNEYFTFQNLFSYQTLFKDVYMLPQANTVCINSASTDIRYHSWWDYDFSGTDETMSFEDARDETKKLFSKAVARQMVSDVPVGSYLSGGMDSGSISIEASHHINRLFTFTCGFDMSEVTGVEANYDERRDAELTANYIKSEHYEQVMNAGDLRWSLPRLVWHLEDLRVGMSYPNFYIARLASKFVKVCLQGTGGDELFGGYPWRYYRIFKSVSRQDFLNQYYDFWQRIVPENEKKELFTSHVINNTHGEEPRHIFEKVFLFNEKLRYDLPEQHINNSLYFEIKTFLPGLLLVGDKLSMAHGLEERFPFLDNDLVNFAQKIPVRYKLGNLESMKRIDENDYRDKKRVYVEYDDGKNVLRKAMSDLLPDKIINRKKQGFSAPDESWYRGENADYVKELLQGKKTVSADFVQPSYINRIIDEHNNKKINHRLLIWSLMNFEWWCRLFLNNERIDQ
jgi:asparagine synthase (glutamine-hydrolysing)